MLTAAYRECYGSVVGHTDLDEMVLVTAPLSSNSEIEALYSANVIDWQSALPNALHSLGCSASEIANAVVRRKEAEKKTDATNSRLAVSEETANEKSSAEVEAQKASTELTQAQIEKTQKETTILAPQTAAAGGTKGAAK